ncbi:hypothetical protein CERZMDRAFT_96640 [Cercospora zeae-maydis SCOH1-5]|uniref:USP domain-containing protein n=1 Tax=Cercospora zeae-maydis SCOH1-5 TaxID=717836 RepID=A0A6A6FHM6_9PEZI|nr:hypothetical protein CERZMDRAFT_96640 [Cercospora zeae-maydis SCOH1-5]
MPSSSVLPITRRGSQSSQMAPKRNRNASESAGARRSPGDDITSPAAKRSRVRSSTSAPIPPAGSPPADPTPGEYEKQSRESNVCVALEVPNNVPRREFPKRKDETSKGMFNPGALCYRNASLQALFHSPPFYHFLATVHQDCDEQANKCVLCALREVLYWYFDSPGTKVDGDGGTAEVARRTLETFTAACKQHPPHDQVGAREIKKNLQSDAFMFIDYLVRERIANTKGVNQELFNDFFELGIEERWKCRHCGKISITPRQTVELGLTVEFMEKDKTQHVLWHLNRGYFYEKLGLWCDTPTCTVLRAERAGKDSKPPLRMFTRRIKRAPEVLVVRIARFGLVKSGNSVTVEKVRERMQVLEFLNLNPYRHKDMKDDCVYRLDGAVGHKGKNVQSGHYVAAVRNEDGRYEVINDSQSIVRSDDFATMGAFNESSDTNGAEFDPYVLVYSKY